MRGTLMQGHICVLIIWSVLAAGLLYIWRMLRLWSRPFDVLHEEAFEGYFRISFVDHQWTAYVALWYPGTNPPVRSTREQFSRARVSTDKELPSPSLALPLVLMFSSGRTPP